MTIDATYVFNAQKDIAGYILSYVGDPKVSEVCKDFKESFNSSLFYFHTEYLQDPHIQPYFDFVPHKSSPQDAVKVIYQQIILEAKCFEISTPLDTGISLLNASRLSQIVQSIPDIKDKDCGALDKRLEKKYNGVSMDAIETLNLKRLQLQHVPLKVGKMKNLKILSLFLNNIKYIPYTIRQLSLTRLCLTSNKLEQLPREICEITTLKTLKLGHNLLSSLPESMVKLSVLETLVLENNYFETIPEFLGMLKNLKKVAFYNNIITSFSKILFELDKLESLDLSTNKLDLIPNEIKQLSNLQHLDLCYNNITDIPKEIADLSRLKFLDLSNNKITDIPKELSNLSELQTINIADNSIDTLPIELLKWQDKIIT